MLFTEELLNLIANRRSIKQNLLKPDPIPRGYIKQMLQAAN